MTKGIIISGEFDRICARAKKEADIELGELIIAEKGDTKFLLQVFDLLYGSQLNQQNLELVSGLKLEENTDMHFFDPNLRSYILAILRNLITIRPEKVTSSKSMPDMFTEIREVKEDDLKFLTKPKTPLKIGKLRSGSKTLNFDIFLDGAQSLAHHILVAGTTGRGKSNLMYNLLWNTLDGDYSGMLVLDPHDEYYGRDKPGLKNHPSKRITYYTPQSPPPGARTLKVNISLLHPRHFDGVMDWSGPQKELLYGYYNRYTSNWIQAVIQGQPVDNFHENTVAVVRRRVMQLLRIDENLRCKGIFDVTAGETTIHDITRDLEDRKTVIIDTSDFAGAVEILVGSMIATEILENHKNAKHQELINMPVVNIVLEEAPRVLGKEVLEQGPNIFSTIAREGRKFKVGLTTITQLPSLIPKEILANINTKIILGLESKPERQAIIDSAAQDLSNDERAIASLDKGEAIITSNFLRFATPVTIPLFKVP